MDGIDLENITVRPHLKNEQSSLHTSFLTEALV